MIGMINSIVSRVVGTVSGPIYSWGAKPSRKKPSRLAKAKARKCACRKKCRCS